MEMPYDLSTPQRPQESSARAAPPLSTREPGHTGERLGSSRFGLFPIVFIYILVCGGRTTREGDEGGTRQREKGRAT